MIFRLDERDNIEKIVSGNYTRWVIGITDDPDRRKEEHKNPAIWFQWQANSELDARYVDVYFRSRGMWGFPDGGDNPTDVYIFQLE